MYIPDFESFYEQAAALYRSNPLQTRYCVKYHRDGALQLKVTDDHKCLQYKTDQQADLRNLERISNLFVTLMTKGDVSQGELEAMENQHQQQNQQAAQAQQPQQQPAPQAEGKGRGSQAGRGKGRRRG